jgi:Tfp pilus assembly protein PilE
MSFAIIVVEILAILANLCVPAYQNARRGAAADAIVREMLQIQSAALSEHTQRGTWAASSAPGTAPDELSSFLPPGLLFQHKDYAYAWQRWALAAPADPDAVPGEDAATPTEFAGVTVVTHDPRLAAEVARRIGPGLVRFTLGNRTTLVVSAPGAPATAN